MAAVALTAASLPAALLQAQKSSAIPHSQRVDARDVRFEAFVTPGTAYVGQAVAYDALIGIRITEGTRVRGAPEYTPPELVGATAYDIPVDTLVDPARQSPAVARAIARAEDGGEAWRWYRYRRVFFPLTAGRTTIPAGTLAVMLANATDPFLAPEPHVMLSAPQLLEIRPLPSGAPAGFTGGVGRFTVTATLDAPTGRVGQPVALTVRVTGAGNVALLRRPVLPLPLSMVSEPGPERSAWDSAASADHELPQGSKEFQWTITPRQAGTLILSPVRYIAFDSESGRYAAVTTAPITILILPGTSDGALLPHVDDAERGTFALLALVALVILAGVVAALRLVQRRVAAEELE